jgi:hypothetical protein
MKKNRFERSLGQHAQGKSSKNGRRPIHGGLRLIVALLLVLLLAATTALAYASMRPLYVWLPVQVLKADRQATVDYQVDVRPAPGAPLQNIGRSPGFLSSTAERIQANFTYGWTIVQPEPVIWSSSVLATLRIREAANSRRILYEQQTVIEPAATGQETVGRLSVERQTTVDLAAYQALATELEANYRIPVASELVIGLRVETQFQLASGSAALVDQPAMVVPLGRDIIEIQAIQPRFKPHQLWRKLPYQVVVMQVPLFVFPIVGMLLITALILWLALTMTRRKSWFDRKLAQMQRLARGRLMLIADKAWEPEWCVTVSHYKTMVRTARKLKHPIFCHVDRQGSEPVAYFYVYYGENNYCLTFGPSGVVADEPTHSPTQDTGDVMDVSSDLDPVD